MQKNISFKAEFGRVLRLLGPYIFLLAVGFGAATSRGSWSVFFGESFKQAFFYGILAWLGLSLYVSAHYKFRGERESRDSNSYADEDDDLPGVNPTTGLPMMGALDSGGNVYGSSSDD